MKKYSQILSWILAELIQKISTLNLTTVKSNSRWLHLLLRVLVWPRKSILKRSWRSGASERFASTGCLESSSPRPSSSLTLFTGWSSAKSWTPSSGPQWALRTNQLILSWNSEGLGEKSVILKWRITNQIQAHIFESVQTFVVSRETCDQLDLQNWRNLIRSV